MHHTSFPKQNVRGFTLIELMIAVTVVGVLASIALPSFETQVQRTRRSDAWIAAMQVQAAQERYRSNAPTYGNLDDIGVSPTSSAGHYTLASASVGTDGYSLSIVAAGMQARDANCRYLKLDMVAMNPVYASGPDASVANAADANRQCWML